MAITVEKLIFSEEENVEKGIHSLPCKIHFDGEAKINDFFTPSCASEPLICNELCVSFRGFPLNGVKVNLPEPYHGFILEEKTDSLPRTVCNINRFKSITYWNWDKKPSKNDLFLSALDWIDLSQVHEPIEDKTED